MSGARNRRKLPGKLVNLTKKTIKKRDKKHRNADGKPFWLPVNAATGRGIEGRGMGISLKKEREPKSMGKGRKGGRRAQETGAANGREDGHAETAPPGKVFATWGNEWICSFFLPRLKRLGR